MLKTVGEQALDRFDFPSFKAPYDQIMRTTWDEMEARGFVEVVNRWNGNTYILSGYGWYVAMKASGQTDDPEFRKRLGVVAVLKGAIKGRRDDAVMEIDDVATKSGLPEDFIYNVIESRIIDREFNRHGAWWHPQFKPGTTIKVPVSFGSEPLG
jgi:hypothetical protein